MIERASAELVKRLAGLFPAVLLLGPRQCGKTTLAKTILPARYFDLELLSDRQVFEGDSELAIRRLTEPLIFDEAQTLPALFSTLRALIDEQRDRLGRFFLLGSVNPVLIKEISESLAGRVGILSLTPFLYREVEQIGQDVHDTLWLRGGFPDAFLAPNTSAWQLWCQNYIRTFVERDIARSGLAFSAHEMRRFMTMIGHNHGGLLNASDTGRSLSVSYHTVNKCLDVVEGHFLIRRLPPYHANIGKRLVKAPKVYIRDSGLLHFLLGIHDLESLITSPARGRSWEGFMIEQIIALEELEHPGSQPFFYRTHTGTEIDLVLDRGQERIGYEFKCGSSITASDAVGLRQGIRDGIIHRGFVVYPGRHSYPLDDSLSVVTAEEALRRS